MPRLVTNLDYQAQQLFIFVYGGGFWYFGGSRPQSFALITFCSSLLSLYIFDTFLSLFMDKNSSCGNRILFLRDNMFTVSQKGLVVYEGT